MLHIHLVALVLATAAFVASGCGGSSKSNDLTQAELVSKGDAICERVHATLHANPYRSQADVGRLAPQLAAYERTAIVEMRKFRPPASLANDWKQIVEGSEIIATDTDKLGEDVKQNNAKAARPLFASSRAVQLKMQAVAERDGFKNCGQPG